MFMTVDTRPKSDSDTCHENLLVPSAAEIGKSSSCIYQVEKLPQLLFPLARHDLKASEEEMLKFGFRMAHTVRPVLMLSSARVA